MTIILSLLLALLKLGNAWAARQDADKLREAGQTKEIARASLALLKTLEKANEVDRALFDDDADPAWVQRIMDRAASSDDG